MTGLPMKNILVIDADRALCKRLTEYLRPEGFLVESAHDGETGLEMALTRCFSLVLLDVVLPGEINGFSALQLIRFRTAIPILMVTARCDEVDRILGLEMGADDCLTKPFNPRELLARIHAVLRRSNHDPQEMPAPRGPGRCRVGDVLVDPARRVVLRSEEFVELTAVEFDLLEVLLRNAGRMVSRAELTKTVLGRDLLPPDRSIDVHVSRLRKKLGREREDEERIKSIRGAGYIYVFPPPAVGPADDHGSARAGLGEGYVEE
jgi:two-component system, OmpR family, response regulator CpxR